MAKKILIVDDEEYIVELIRMNLKREGYQPICAYSGQEALEKAWAEKPDLILLDVMMPDMDGLETCRKLRENHLTQKVPIIILSAKSEETDKVIGLGVGADDYMTKPFGIRELLARINAHLRRTAVSEPEDEKICVGDLQIDSSAHAVTINGKPVNLTLTEYQILKYMAENAGHVIQREQLVTALSGTMNLEIGSINVHMLNLRRKVGEQYFVTIRGLGYKMVNPKDA
ncbi:MULTISPECIES: response regulator transcription factor [Caproicibacterium]|uniref:response regulator transcription factor n=1 Tax=Caproicibacterium TaxID=2834348 RepID=UPI001F389368|nr:response regulator transcription factor [Caproicibacterium lactatifermentans]